ncbi:DinB family protein [Corynebacterium pilosum]|uniref:DinB superfamily n=1 Tax=Corynebacterium pilosum TaxID=35756 RepID=A0A376CLX5_9CORY|nr:DinB family protein [Corynebacterium pilosum]STC69323.1 Uncharacterised protein [Corynebacterium pilosum]
MNTTAFITDLADRAEFSLNQIRDFTPAEFNAHPQMHPNSAAWLLWHTGREMDAQLAALSDHEEVWTAEGFQKRFGLGELGDSFGYGHSQDEARSIQIEDQQGLTEYVRATIAEVKKRADQWEKKDWEEVIDTYNGEDITRAVRVTSLLIDAIEHLAQVNYIAGCKDFG